MDALLALLVIWALVALGLALCAALWLGPPRRSASHAVTEPRRTARGAA